MTVQVPPLTDFRYGDRVCAEGKLQTPTDSRFFLVALARSVMCRYGPNVFSNALASFRSAVSKPSVNQL